MKMYYIQFADLVRKTMSQRRCPIESPKQRTRKISNLNAFQINWKSDWHWAGSRPVNICSKDLNFVPSSGQRFAEGMSSKDWASITHGGQVARNDVEDPHKSIARLRSMIVVYSGFCFQQI